MIHDLRTFMTCFMKYEVIEDLSEKKKRTFIFTVMYVFLWRLK